MNEPDFSMARVGDKVVSLTMGPGVIDCTENASRGYAYPIKVILDNHTYGTFTKKGFRYASDTRPDLYYADVEITITGGCEPPKRTVTKTVWQNLHYCKGVGYWVRRWGSEAEALENRDLGHFHGVVELEIEVEE